MKANILRLKALGLRSAAGAAGALALASSAHATATPIDVADVVSQIGAAIVPVGLIGAAVLLVVVSIKAFHWVKRAIS